MFQTILGAGGAIGTPLAKELKKYTDKIRLVGRNPKRVNPEDELFHADLTNAKETNEAVEGSEIAYLTVGLTYNLKIWQAKWPIIMQNVIEACKVHKCKLVFFDNIYMYDANSLQNIKEDNPINPPSKKGKVRAEILELLMQAIKGKEIEALVARAADFYGPGIKDVSMLTETVFKPLSAGKGAQCMGQPNVKHSYTYVPDAAKATAILGNTPDAFSEVWHLPTASNPLTNKQYIDLIAEKFGAKPKFMSVNKWMLKLMGLFMPVLKEMPEMLYQYDRDYVFNSKKFEKKFNFTPTSYQQGIDEVIKSDYS